MQIPKEYNQPGVYCILNTITGKKYIGSSLNIKARLRSHYSELLHNKHDNSHLQRSYNKYGVEYFIWGVIEFCESHLAVEREQYYLNSFVNWNDLYNNRRIAESNRGVKRGTPSDEIKLKCSLGHKNYLKTIGGKPLNFQEAQLKAWEKTRTEIFEFNINGLLINHYYSIKEASEKTGIFRETIAACSNRKHLCKKSQTYFRRTNKIE